MGLSEGGGLLSIVIFLRALVDVARIVAQVLLTVHSCLLLDRLGGTGAETTGAKVLLLRVFDHDGNRNLLRQFETSGFSSPLLIHLDLSEELLVDFSSHVIFVCEKVRVRISARVVPHEQFFCIGRVTTARCHSLLAVEAILGHLKLLASLLLV